MLTSFQINWYKPFTRLEIDRLTRVTAIGGPNNCGKTSLLEAIFLFFDRNNPEQLLRSLGWRGFGQVSGSPEQLFSHSFHDFNLDHSIVLLAKIEGQHLELEYTFVPSDAGRSIPISEAYESGASSERNSGDPGKRVPDAVQIRLRDAETRELIEDGTVRIEKGSLKIEGTISRSGLPPAKYQGLRVRSTAQEDAERLGVLEVERASAGLLEFTKRFFPDIRSLDAIPGASPMIYADVGLPKKIPLPALGDGVSRLVSYYLSGSIVRDGGVLLLDEVGSGIHHSLLPRLWEGLFEIANHFNCQIIATSHSYECLSAAVTTQTTPFSEEFSYLRLNQELHSREVRVVSYGFDEFRAAIENDWEIR